MRTDYFTYHLPEELIAQSPSEKRDHSRMMIVHRSTGQIECSHFYALPRFLKTGDILVVNDSRVIPARLIGHKATGGAIELLLLEQQDRHTRWVVLLRPGKRVKKGTKIFFDTASRAEVIEQITEKKWLCEFRIDADFETFLERHGKAPLPPYIKRKEADGTKAADLERYQTVYARVPGSIAAPTAGLHFSDETIALLKVRNIPIAPVTLHVGFGTFLPIETDRVEDHVMESENFSMTATTAAAINEAKRVVAVGTTSVRTLESSVDDSGKVLAGHGTTRLFIYPGFQFRAVDALLTNFHLPASSLFLLVCAFGGTELMREAYRCAVEEKFRFYSYGDCMLIL